MSTNISYHLASKLINIQSSFDAQSSGVGTDADVLERAPRKRRRAKQDRGLPPEEEIFRLAKTYLERQRKLWPELVEKGLLPEPSEAVLREMVDDFKARHYTGKIDPKIIEPFLGIVKKLGGAYHRFSCDNSDPKSIIDQHYAVLDRAKTENQFIPWAYVFCDYSVSGLDSARQGYTSYKRILDDSTQSIATTYIDDFTRASRLELEWWRLAYLSKKLNKGLIGASDNFTLGDPDWDTKVSLYALISRLFIKSLQQKVRRGMKGTARNRGTLGAPPIGFTRKVKRDEQGNVVRDVDGIPKTVPCFDPKTREIVVLIFDLFVVSAWSPHQITRVFNERKIGNWNNWRENHIRKILRNPAYVGVFIWNKFRRELNPETEAWEQLLNPRKEWVVYYDPKLALVDRKIWKKARRKLGPDPAMTPKEKRRTEGPYHSGGTRVAKWLFHDTLFCEYCESPLRLLRSAGPYKDVYCVNGPAKANGCRLSTSKALKIIEESILEFLWEGLLTEESLLKFIETVNTHLKEESVRPLGNTKSFRRKAKSFEDKIEKLMGLIEDEDDKAICERYHVRIKQLQNEFNDLHRQITAEERRNAPPPQPLNADRVHEYVQDLRGILNDEISTSAELLRSLTGKVKVREEKVHGRKRGAKWIVTFSPNLINFLARLGVQKKYSETANLEALKNRNIGSGDPIVLKVDGVPSYEREAPRASEIFKKERSVNKVARIMGVTWKTAKQMIDFALEGKRPIWSKPGKKRSKGVEKKISKTKLIGPDVVRLKDEEHLSWPRIATWLKEHRGINVSEGTVMNAWDAMHRDGCLGANSDLEFASRKQRYSHLGEGIYQQIREGLRAHKSPKEIARETGCGVSTVRRELYKLRKGGEL